MNERGLVEKIKKAIKREHPEASWVMKVHGSPYQMLGVPDLLVIIRGTVIAMEVKLPAARESAEHARGRASVHQQEQIRLINEAGGHATIVLSVEEALGFVAQAVGGGVVRVEPEVGPVVAEPAGYYVEEPEIPQRQVEFDLGDEDEIAYSFGQKGSGAVHLMDGHSSLCGSLDSEEATVVSGPETCKRCQKIHLQAGDAS